MVPSKEIVFLIFNGNKVTLWKAFQGYNAEILGLLQIKCLVIIVCMEIRLALWPHTVNYENAASYAVDFVWLACGSGARKLFSVQTAPLTWLSYHCPAAEGHSFLTWKCAHIILACIFLLLLGDSVDSWALLMWTMVCFAGVYVCMCAPLLPPPLPFWALPHLATVIQNQSNQSLRGIWESY